MSTLAPVRPSGLTTALPAAPVTDLAADLAAMDALSLCPQQQITVTDRGEPFIHAPSMKSAFTTKSQTREDMQLDEATDNDTD